MSPTSPLRVSDLSATCSQPDTDLILSSEPNLIYDDDEIAYFTVCWKTRASFVYRTNLAQYVT